MEVQVRDYYPAVGDEASMALSPDAFAKGVATTQDVILRADQVSRILSYQPSFAIVTLKLRLSGWLPPAVACLERLEHGAPSAEAESALVSLLGVLCSISGDKECAEELGVCRFHALLKRGERQRTWPWTCDTLSQAVLDALAVTLDSLGTLVMSSSLDALDERRRPFTVRYGKNEESLSVILRQVPEDLRESGTGDRANIRVGYRLWGGAIVLGGILYSMGEQGTLRDASVLEIGAGLGLCGLVAARRRFGASRVVLSDFHPRIVSNLNYNASLNRRDDIPNVCEYELDWELVHTCKYDGFLKQESFDIVVGSDLVCEKSDCLLVAQVLKASLASHGVAFVTLGSQESRFGVEAFKSTLEEQGFRVSPQSNFKVPAICLPPKGGCVVDSTEPEVFIGTARSYVHFEIRFV